LAASTISPRVSALPGRRPAAAALTAACPQKHWSRGIHQRGILC
jgi:hypothetical protein